MKIFAPTILAIVLIQPGWADEIEELRNGSNEAHLVEGSSQSTKTLDIVRMVAKQREIVLDGWVNGTHIELSADETPLIIQETTGSITKYLSITPVVSFNKKSLTIDCSYVRSYDSEVLSVGTYCRGDIESSADNVEEAINERHMFKYSRSVDWLAQANRVAQCPQPSGLKYFDLYVLRCDSTESDETTDGVTIFFLDELYRVKLRVHGYEFSPRKSDSKPRHGEFWGVHRNSPYEIIAKDL
ncbi:hypothetical protein C4K14_4074 [Pseudomonas chlororaphis subsp. aureofaciens]|uniref:hypothetical protein n=1 Tax=Pseudomonas chlororaphis TaxID=587753 RepID=UPI000F569ADB|nr:hypothetical protein [Pseudomonas chlororaphis]AZD86896.1 hypothetical protein C4K14_4074 [Pseudomonas chlororaphis subsp. aureofaciens]